MSTTPLAAGASVDGLYPALRVTVVYTTVNLIPLPAVRRVGNQVRINAHLIDTETGRQLWAERYQGRLTDTFALQDKVTARIIEALSVKLGADEMVQLVDHGTEIFEAHDAFLKGQSYARQYTPEGTAQAIKMFELALTLDPNYSRAGEAIKQILFIHENSGLK